MRARTWLHYFIQACKRTKEPKSSDGEEWTEFMGKILDVIAEKTGCYVVRYRLKPTKDEPSREYLGIDAVFIDEADRKLLKEKGDDSDPLVLPRAVVELENRSNIKVISYCLWKLLCVRAPLRVLICYRGNTKKVTSLKRHLDGVVWKGSLAKGSDGDLLVIVGNESLRDADWKEYFTVFEWRSDKLIEVKGLEW